MFLLVMIKYFIIAFLVLVALSFVKIKGKRLVNLRRFLFMLALLPLVFLVVFFSSVIIALVLVMFIVIFVIGYVYVMFSKKGRGKVVVIR